MADPQARTDEQLVFQGQPLKVLGTYTKGGAEYAKLGGYLVVFSGPDSPDLVGDFFTAKTDFGTLSRKGRAEVPSYYQHGFDAHFKGAAIGDAELSADEYGVWAEHQVELRTDYERHLLDMAKKGQLGQSSGAVGHLVEMKSAGGKVHEITRWPIGEASLTPTPAEPRTSAQPIKAFKAWAATQDALAEPVAPAPEAPDAIKTESLTPTVEPMENPTKPTEPTVEAPTKAAPEAPAVDVNAIAAAAAQQAADATMKAFRESQTPTTPVKAQYDTAPAVITDASHWKFDGKPIEDIAFAADVIESMGADGPRAMREGPSAAMLKALAMRLHSDEGKGEHYAEARSAMKAAGLDATKANELNQSTLANFGDEWIGQAYSSQLWASIRHEATLAGKIPTFEFPAGAESLTMPLEGADPTLYKVAQASGVASPDVGPAATVTSSRLGTANAQMTLAKFGARSLWTGEMTEDSLIAFVPQLRAQYVATFSEGLDSAIFDGDSDTSATTNINDIAGTPGGSEYWLNFDGIRKSALVTTAANSRDAGALAASDFLETIKLMGAAGKNALDRSKVEFWITPGVHWKALELSDVKSRDVFVSPTIENGELNGIYGYRVNVSTHLCKPDPNGAGLSNASGKIDQDTAGNNTKGTIAAIRYDQWRLGFRRRLTLETTRIARADAYEIVGLMRAGLMQRDTEAAAISYNVTV